MTTISIITPSLNAQKYLTHTITSCQQANMNHHIEHIIIDGNSTDGTIDIIKAHENKLAYWRSEPDGGAAVAQNKGLQQVTGDIVGFLNADDWYEPHCLANVINAFCTHPNIDIVTCLARLVKFIPKQNNYQEIKRYHQDDLELTPENICYGVSAFNARFFRRSAIEKLGEFITVDQSGKHFFTNDKEYLLRAYFLGLKNQTINSLGYTYLAHSDSYNFSPKPEIKRRIYFEHTMLADLLQKHFRLKDKEIKFLNHWKQSESIKYFFQSLKEIRVKEAYQFLKVFLAQKTLSNLTKLITFPMKIIFKKLSFTPK